MGHPAFHQSEKRILRSAYLTCDLVACGAPEHAALRMTLRNCARCLVQADTVLGNGRGLGTLDLDESAIRSP